MHASKNSFPVVLPLHLRRPSSRARHVAPVATPPAAAEQSSYLPPPTGTAAPVACNATFAAAQLPPTAASMLVAARRRPLALLALIAIAACTCMCAHAAGPPQRILPRSMSITAAAHAGDAEAADTHAFRHPAAGGDATLLRVAVPADSATLLAGSDDTAAAEGMDLGHGCHSCACLPRCRSGRCNIARPCSKARCTGHCKWPKRSKRGRPIGACRIGNCSRFGPGYMLGAGAGTVVVEEGAPP